MLSKIASAIPSTLSKIAAFQKPVVYNAKVFGELAKQVYTKEGMAFPNAVQFNQAQEAIQKVWNLSTLKALTWRDAAKGSIIAAEIYTFFLVGEIVGRRNLIGYNVTAAAESSH